MKKLLYMLIVLVTILLSCKNWVSVDISNEEVTLISPLENQSDSLLSKTFVWEELEGANGYRLQIVSTSFDSILIFVLDSLVNATSYTAQLTPNQYEWRVRGENDDFNSAWTVRKLSIASSGSLANQEITNFSLEDNTISNEYTHTFTWNELPAKDYYSILIKDSDGEEVESENTEKTSFTYTFPKDDEFTVSLKAINSLSASITIERKIIIDSIMPSVLIYESPLNEDTVKSFPVEFTWKEKTKNTGTEITERFIISTDSIMSNKIIDTTFTGTSLSFDTISRDGKLFWKIEREDAAGNSSTNAPQEFWIK